MTAFYTERLSHRLLEEQDIAFAASLYQNPKVMRKIGPVLSPDNATKLIVSAVKMNQKEHATCLLWLIEKRDTCEPIGIQMLKWPSVDSKSVEIGIILTPTSNGKGFAFEGMGALVDVGFQHLNIDTIFANFQLTNLAVKKFVTQLGFSVLEPNQHQSYCELSNTDWDRKVEAITIR